MGYIDTLVKLDCELKDDLATDVIFQSLQASYEPCWDNLPWVPCDIGYGPKLLSTVGSLQRQMAGEPYTPYQETTPSLQAEEMGPPTYEELISITYHAIISPPYD
jgi:hypothetical protein